jgi:hypothetical protein
MPSMALMSVPTTVLAVPNITARGIKSNGWITWEGKRRQQKKKKTQPASSCLSVVLHSLLLVWRVKELHPGHKPFPMV